MLLRVYQQVNVLHGGGNAYKAHAASALMGKKGQRAHGDEVLADAQFVEAGKDLNDKFRRSAHAVSAVQLLVQLQGLSQPGDALARHFFARDEFFVRCLSLGTAGATRLL